MLDFRPHLGINQRGHLTLGGADLVELAEKYGTPLYVYDEQRIRQRYREFRDAFAGYGDVLVCYACKANTSLAVLSILRHEGAGADIVSEGELYLALKAGFQAEKIIFTGNNKSDRELERAVEAGVVINLDSLHELERLIEIVEAQKAEAKVSFRVNPEVSPETHPHLATGLRESKFGIHEELVLKAYERALSCSRLDVAGIHMHIGSQITKVEPYVEATRRLFDIMGRLRRELNLELEFADLGGGVGIRYSAEQPYITPAQLAEALLPVIEEKLAEHSLPRPRLLFEPGRYIVGDAGVLLARVYTIKATPYKKFIGCDAGFNLLLRPAMYGAYHEVVVANRAGEAPAEEVTVAGNLCESGDLLAKDRSLPRIEKGDVLAFLDAGAYGFVMASQYNSRPRCAEVLVNRGRAELIRYAEDFEDLAAKQLVPERLK
ncbi:MAG: diaminopimelate decarboxylase [Euryarchaeota archaeon]|nr:diaminopimelate decarboxylase [Euryarchaeota archaeon]